MLPPTQSAPPSSSSPEELLAEGLRDTRLLRDLSVTLVTGDSIHAITGELLGAAVQITGADFGSLQVLRRGDQKLELLASSGFDPATVAAWKVVPADACAAGARALATEQRYTAREIIACELMRGTATAEFYAAAGIRSVQYTPLVSRRGRIVGLLATHWREPREASEREVLLLDVVARQAADLIERQQSEDELRKTVVDYRTLFNSIDEGFCIFEMIFDSAGRAVDYRFLKVNPAFERHTGLHDALGKRMRELAPEHEEHWFEIYGQVAMTGEPVRFERPASQLGERWFDLYAFRVAEPEQRQVAVVFSDITARKKAAEELRQARDELEERVEQRTLELRKNADQLRHLAAELTRSEQRERTRMAVLLHDHVQQLLVSAKMRCEGLRRNGGEKQKEDASAVVDLLGECLGSLRSLTVELSPPILSDGLVPALEWLGGVWMKDKHQLEVKLDLDWSVDAVNHDIRSLVFLAVRELLFNVVKHSGVKEASVKVAAENASTLRVTVKDAGQGFDLTDIPVGKAGRTGLGLLNVRERIGMLGGTLEILSSPGHGAEVVILVPRVPDSTAAEQDLA
jgi:PAS domain S-box-containing protein